MRTTKEKDTNPLLPLGSGSLSENETTWLDTATKSWREDDSTTPKILSKKSSAELNGPDETESGQEQHGMSGAVETEMNKTQKNMPAVADEILLTESQSSFPSLSAAPSDLESLLEDSAKHLHSLMKGMFTQSEMERAKADCHTFDQHRVATAATVARQIVNVVRAGLDMAKVRVKVEQLKNKPL